MTEPIVLKKYANRRIYDPQKSEYVTLKEVSDMIRSGRHIQVIDVKTTEDVTALILTQIILEEAKHNNTLLPVPILHQIIQYGDNVLGDFFNKHLQKTIRHYMDYKGNVESQYEKWLDLGKDMSRMTQKTLKDIHPFQSIFDDYFKSDDNPDEK
ncbi:MAG: transcriptional regulator [Deltaproteobacteria bacterium]|nr:transcriptional regulator [Deltaproteobacteria bacterium]